MEIKGKSIKNIAKFIVKMNEKGFKNEKISFNDIYKVPVYILKLIKVVLKVLFKVCLYMNEPYKTPKGNTK